MTAVMTERQPHGYVTNPVFVLARLRRTELVALVLGQRPGDLVWMANVSRMSRERLVCQVLDAAVTVLDRAPADGEDDSA